LFLHQPLKKAAANVLVTRDKSVTTGLLTIGGPVSHDLVQQATERIKPMSDNTLDFDQTDAKVIDEVSDEALEAAAGMDHGQRPMTVGAPIWCPDSSGLRTMKAELAA